jgi:hypothetical protein
MRKMTIATRLTLAVLAVQLLGCSSQGKMFLQQKPQGSPHANIVFTRTRAMLGAIVPHIIVDRGTGTDYDGVLVERRDFTNAGGSFAKMGNVLMLARYDANGGLKRIAGLMSKCGGAWLAVDESTAAGDGAKIPLSSIVCVPDVGGLPANVQVQDEVEFEEVDGELVARIKKQVNASGTRRVANAQFIGSVTSGDKLRWSRPEGWMRLYAVAPYGDMANSEPFYVRAGRTYAVNYNISTVSFSSAFEVSEISSVE